MMPKTVNPRKIGHAKEELSNFENPCFCSGEIAKI